MSNCVVIADILLFLSYLLQFSRWSNLSSVYHCSHLQELWRVGNFLPKYDRDWDVFICLLPCTFFGVGLESRGWRLLFNKGWQISEADTGKNGIKMKEVMWKCCWRLLIWSVYSPLTESCLLESEFQAFEGNPRALLFNVSSFLFHHSHT